jgi:penicillin-binding protein 2
VVTVEKGGFGAETAAPAARKILSKWFDVNSPVPKTDTATTDATTTDAATTNTATTTTTG